jgi:hypothetical protein
MERFCAFVVVLMAASGCTKRTNYCGSDADCTDPAYPFCDVDGQYAPSNGDANTCTIIPPDCPVDRCGCSPGVAMCGSGALQTCNADGMSVAMETCALGCGSNGTSCATFTPSNSLAAALASSASESIVDIPDGATIDTDTGTISGTVVTSTVVTVQNQPIRVFAAPSWVLPNLRITGTQPVAFVATGAIQLQGVVDLSSSSAAGAGADTDFACHGGGAQGFAGAGGGGGATLGGSGGGATGYAVGVGGNVATGFSPLFGGCSGGASTAAAGDGGGGIQLVSATSVSIAGYIDVSGGGGGSSAGGGAGGMVIIESPSLVISSGGIVANGGGGGGGCGTVGADGGNGDTPATGGVCSDPTRSGGNGGTDLASAESGGDGVAGSTLGVAYGGGGGAIGRARIATGSGAFEQGTGTVMSIAVISDMLVHD